MVRVLSRVTQERGSMESVTFERSVRYILRCPRKSCGTMRRQDTLRTVRSERGFSEATHRHWARSCTLSEVDITGASVQEVRCPSCGSYMTRIEVTGRKGVQKCGARCHNAKGGDCECECGGQNHGHGHAPA